MPYGAVPGFVTELRQNNDAAACALELIVLLALRRGEVVEARWDEIDLGERLWVIPPERMKANREHKIPLPPRAVAILRELETTRCSDYVFVGARSGRPMSATHLANLMDRLGVGAYTIHGFRSAFRDWTSERTNFPHEVAEAALAHVVADATVAAYRRTNFFDKRRKLMEAWERFCATPSMATGGEVVALRG